MAAVYDDPDKLAKAIRDARGAMSQGALARWLGRDRKTIGRWEAGDEASLGRTPEKRRAVAILVAEATGRRDLFGLSAPEPEEVDRLRRELLDELEATRAELLEEIERVRRAPTSERQPPKPAEGD